MAVLSDLEHGAATARPLRRAVLFISVALIAAAASGDGACGSSEDVEESALLQVRHEQRRVEQAAMSEIWSGATIFLRVARTGKRITFGDNDGEVHARWDHVGSWQEIQIVRLSGVGALQSGDTVLLRGHWGRPLTVEGAAVHSKWDHEGGWQQLVIETREGGPVVDGSTVFLRAHTGKRIDADAPDAPGSVQARYSDMGSWQELVIELKAAQVSAQALQHFIFLNELRRFGFTCPGGQHFPPNDTPLKFDCRLEIAARLHSKDMAERDFFSHVSSDGRDPWARAAEQGTTANAENIAAGRGAADATLDQFKQSDGHCKNMMNPAFTVAAVGYAAGGSYRHYWTQMFRRSGDVDSSCYPRMSLAQAQGSGAHVHEVRHGAAAHGGVLSEPWTQ